jgi:hypothetical protein
MTLRPRILRPLQKWDDASLGHSVPWMMRPYDNASHGLCIPVTLRPCHFCDNTSPFFGTDNPFQILLHRNSRGGQSIPHFLGNKINCLLVRFIPDLLKLRSVAEPYHFDAAPDPFRIQLRVQILMRSGSYTTIY